MKSTPKSIKPAVSAQGIATSKASSSLTGQTSMAAYGALGLALLHGIGV